MSLQFTNIDDAFSPLSQKKRKEKRSSEAPYEEYTEAPPQLPPPPQQQPGQVPLSQYHQQPVLVDHHKSFAEEMFAVQPYINNLFMLIVLGMLYDIRQAALDCKLYMVKHSM
jgi:hypothetical protein